MGQSSSNEGPPSVNPAFSLIATLRRSIEDPSTAHTFLQSMRNVSQVRAVFTEVCEIHVGVC